MGDLSKARRELEDLYVGVDDDCVNLTFEDLSQLSHLSHHIAISKTEEPTLTKSPSLDFSRAFENTINVENHHHHHINNIHGDVHGLHNYMRRAGIPHSNICTFCSTYIYLFRHRCLVCGRVYYGQCVGIGMGEMTEGRKCIQCLGIRFSQRYIKKAGKMGCCMGYESSRVKQQELIWAEKGPRRARSSSMKASHSTPSSMMASPYSFAYHTLPL